MKLRSAWMSCAVMFLMLGGCADSEDAAADDPAANAPPDPVCGNEDTENGEDCDDGNNGDDDDGCTDECTFSCADHLDCDDLNGCNGRETCDATTHTCVAGTPVTCDDANFCTADSCRPANDNTYSCRNDLVDDDGDGFAAGNCPDDATPGGDCDDHNKIVNPGQRAHFLSGYGEFGDNFDYNCDGEESWDDDVSCSSPDCCEIWQDSFMNPSFEFPVCGSSASRMRRCFAEPVFWLESRPCH